MARLGDFIWKISVALYLLATGVLALNKGGHLAGILTDMFGRNIDFLIIIAGVIALLAGVFLLLELFNVKVPILDTLLLIVAIIWIVFAVFMLIRWIGGGFKNFWDVLQQLGIYVMVSASLLIASKKFGS